MFAVGGQKPVLFTDFAPLPRPGAEVPVRRAPRSAPPLSMPPDPDGRLRRVTLVGPGRRGRTPGSPPEAIHPPNSANRTMPDLPRRLPRPLHKQSLRFHPSRPPPGPAATGPGGPESFPRRARSDAPAAPGNGNDVHPDQGGRAGEETPPGFGSLSAEPNEPVSTPVLDPHYSRRPGNSGLCRIYFRPARREAGRAHSAGPGRPGPGEPGNTGGQSGTGAGPGGFGAGPRLHRDSRAGRRHARFLLCPRLARGLRR